MIYSLDNLRTYTRSLDNRLEDVVKYPNSWIDDRIDEGIATAQEIRPIFSTKET
jgi:hypothetical protein